MTYVLFLSIDTPFIQLFVTARFQFEKELLGRLSRSMRLAGLAYRTRIEYPSKHHGCMWANIVLNIE